MYTWTLKIMYTCLIIMCTRLQVLLFCTHVCHNFYCTQVHSWMCTIFLLSTYEIMIEIQKFIFFFINLFIIERSCNHWPINSKVYIFTIPTKRCLCHTSKFCLYTCTPQFILYTYRLTDVHNFFVVDI